MAQLALQRIRDEFLRESRTGACPLIADVRPKWKGLPRDFVPRSSIDLGRINDPNRPYQCRDYKLTKKNGVIGLFLPAYKTANFVRIAADAALQAKEHLEPCGLGVGLNAATDPHANTWARNVVLWILDGRLATPTMSLDEKGMPTWDIGNDHYIFVADIYRASATLIDYLEDYVEMSPSDMAKKFSLSLSGLKYRIDNGMLPVTKVSTKLWRINRAYLSRTAGDSF